MRQNRKTAYDFRNQSKRLQILRSHILEIIVAVDGSLAGICRIPHYMRVQTLRYLSVYAVKCTSADKQDVFRIDRYHLLFGVLASALGRHIDDRPLQKFQEPLLHALAADIACYGRVVTLACYLVDFVDKHYATFSLRHIIIRSLEQTGQQTLDVLTHIAGFSQHSRIHNCKRHIEKSGYGLGEQRLACTCRSYEDDIALFYVNIVVLVLRKAFVMVIHRY